MSPDLVGLIGVIAILVLFLLRVQIGITMLVVGFVGYWYLVNWNAALSVVGMVPFASASNYGLSVLPLFILMGLFLAYGGLGRDIFQAVDAWFRHVRGGLAISTIGACAAFAAVSGSATATAATIGSIALPEMKRYGYADSMATATVAVAGTLGILIPPSTVLVIYGILTEQSIGQLLIAGIIPGFMLAGMMMLTIYFQVRIKPSMAPTQKQLPWKAKFVSLKKIWPILVIFLLVMGGMYTGFFTPTEAAAFGAFTSLIFAIVTRQFSRKVLTSSLDQTVRTTAMLFLILIGAMVFSRFLAVTRLPYDLTEMIAALEISRYAVMLIIIFSLVVLGCFIEGISIMVLTLPVLYPLILELGFDGIWFGILLVVLLNIGMITPPVGINVFVTAGIAKDVPLMTIFRGIVPLLITMIVFCIILLFFPQIATFLPNLMRG
ncbi:MAG TPA: TRAP transporter large permease [Dehalococcoidales bacterium]|nr:TRAP transporter large permease [Dehalococcoidales bacterium]